MIMETSYNVYRCTKGVLIANIEDDGILGMDFLGATNASIDVAGNKINLNKEVFYLNKTNLEPSSFRCFTWPFVVFHASTVPIYMKKMHHSVCIMEWKFWVFCKQ